MSKTSKAVTKIFYTLKDKDVENSQKNVNVEVECSNDSVYILLEGYSDASSPDGEGCPVMLEVWEGELRVVVWSDINKEDPTHIISLQGAREELRKIDDDQFVSIPLSELEEIRYGLLEDIWENYDLGLDNMGLEFADSDGWEHTIPSNEYSRKFYYYKHPSTNKPSETATFVVTFHPNSTKAFDISVDY
jgi:hypothetical protein